jgi:uncharacterized protein (DUF1330 family)
MKRQENCGQTIWRPCARCFLPRSGNSQTGAAARDMVNQTWERVDMTKGYWVAFADISDPEGYKAYMAENAKAFSKFGARFLVRGGRYEAAEGKPRSRTVVIEFPSYQAAVDCYHSPEYAKAKALRNGKSVMDLSIVEGHDAP